MSLSKRNLKDIEKAQANFVKSFIGIGKTYRTSPLLNALKIKNITSLILTQNINLLRNVLNVNSAARDLNLHFLNSNIDINGSLIHRVKNICDTVNLNFMETVLDSNNVNDVFQTFPRSGDDGLIDSLRSILHSTFVDRELVKLLLRSF